MRVRAYINGPRAHQICRSISAKHDLQWPIGSTRNRRAGYSDNLPIDYLSDARACSDETSAEDEEKEAVVVVKESQVRAFCDHAVARFFKM